MSFSQRYNLSQPRLTERVRDVLIELIESGEVGADHRLPPEPELAKALGVGRTTLRAALSLLEQRKLILRRPGIGTLVNPSALRIRTQITDETGFQQLIRDSGHEPGVGFQAVRQEALSLKAARALRLQDGTKALICERVFLATREPAIFCVDMVPLALLKKGFAGDEQIRTSIFDFLREYCEEEADYGVAEVLPVNADQRLARLLDIPAETALLLLEETYYNNRGEPLLFSEIYYRDDIIRFRCIRRVVS
ncbi:MAG TPA: GntR family transcriptional regulator [Firmicutes bacterium]|nr:GntR family transcriptional regulator [Bacillota bacterium]